jgi:hypothetical protein
MGIFGIAVDLLITVPIEPPGISERLFASDIVPVLDPRHEAQGRWMPGTVY